MSKGGMDLDHAMVRWVLSASLDGLVTGRGEEDAAAHLGVCAACRAFGETLACTVLLVRHLPRVRLPDSAHGRLMARLEAAVRTPVGA